MNLFDKLVNEALKNQPDLAALRVVVEKELLHHDILRILSQNHLLKDLAFMGGTALRSCYGGNRLSEDLDFTGGTAFSRKSLSSMGAILSNSLNEKYGLETEVSEPIKDTTNVDTWKIKVKTRPEHRHMPAQRINIDICAVNSYEKQPMMLINPYGVDMGTSGLIIQTQSQEEIFSDKLLAFALRANRIKYRDLWDISWLHQKGIKPRLELIPLKLKDRHLGRDYFMDLFAERLRFLSTDDEVKIGFKKEMERFLPKKQIPPMEVEEEYWAFIAYLMQNLMDQIGFHLK